MAQGERRLAAIMFTDMVGYTALAQSDEYLALKVLERHNQLLRSIFPRYHGREVKVMGDSFLVEFGSALDATKCAVEIQRFLHDYSLSSGDEWRIRLRIGIHLGDVVHSGDDVLGDAVNIASRIQPLADPEGACVSQQVYDQIGNKLTSPIVKLEQKTFKNLQFPLEVYKIVMPWEEVRLTAERLGSETSHRLAVLPFTNISPDPTDEYFADGLTEELISTLSIISGLRVIARTSVMKYKGLGRGVREIGRELNVGTAIEGSVRKAGERLRIGVQLIDAQTEEYLWVQNYDRELQDIFAVQSEIAQKVAEALTVQLRSGEKRTFERRPTENTEAHYLYLKGRYYWNERTREGMDKAAKYFEEAIKLDPRFALAYAALADCNVVSPSYGWTTPKEGFPTAKEYALRAIEIDPRLAEPHASLAMVYADYEYRWDDAEDEFERAVELKASYATAYHWYSIILAFMGKFNESCEQAKRASALDPLSQIISVNLGVALLGLGRVKEAVEQFERVSEEDPKYITVHNYLGWAYYLDSRTEEAIGEQRKSVALSGDDPQYEAELACLLGFVGRRDEANEIIENLKGLSKTTYVSKVRMAFALFGAGRTDEAFDYLEKAYEERSSNILYFRVWPWFKEARQDPRWASLEKRFGLPRN